MSLARQCVVSMNLFLYGSCIGMMSKSAALVSRRGVAIIVTFDLRTVYYNMFGASCVFMLLSSLISTGLLFTRTLALSSASRARLEIATMLLDLILLTRDVTFAVVVLVR